MCLAFGWCQTTTKVFQEALMVQQSVSSSRNRTQHGGDKKRVQIFLLHSFCLTQFLFAVKRATNIFSKQEKGLKLSNRHGMRKVKSQLSVSFSSFSSTVLPVLWTTPSPTAQEQDQILQPQDTRAVHLLSRQMLWTVLLDKSAARADFWLNLD